MGLLWCGGEDIDFPNTNDGTLFNFSGSARSGYGRGGARLDYFNSHLVWSDAFPGGGITSGWLAARVYLDTSTANKRAFGLVDNATTTDAKGIYVGSSDTARRIAIFKWDGSTQTLLAKSSVDVYPAGAGNYRISMQIIDYGAAATINLYVDGTLALTYSGDISIAGVSALNSVAIVNLSNAHIFNPSEFIVHTDDTRLMSVLTMYPSAAGDSNAWSGAYTDIDETPNVDTDYIYTNSDAQDALFNLPNVPAGIPDTIIGGKVVVRACKTAGAAVSKVKLGVKTGGTVDVDAGQTVTESWDTFERLMTTFNGGTIDQTAANALQLALRSAT